MKNFKERMKNVKSMGIKNFMQEKKLNNEGFTLMELIIVVAIIAILIALIAPNLTSFLDTATNTSYDANAKSCYTAASAWVTQERISGSVITGTITVNNSKVSSEGTLTTEQKKSLAEALDNGSFGNSVCKITFENGKCKSVEWFTDSKATEAAAKYPKN